ncbi:MAG: MFS transporter [Gudongella sp.]|jgi:MFS family permease|nr:MFS transporter [Gudongella sp.]
MNIFNKEYRSTYIAFLWHGFFLALTMATIELNTVLSSLISLLTDNPVAFGAIYSILLGAPLVFNLIFSRYLENFAYKKKFLLIGIYVRGASFLGMSLVTLFFAQSQPFISLLSFYLLIFIFSISGGLAGIAYSDIVGKLLPPGKRGELYAAIQLVSGLAALGGGFLIAWLFKPGVWSFPANYAISFFIGFLGLILGALGFWMVKEPETTIKSVPDGDKKEGLLNEVFVTLRKDKTLRRFIIIENITGFSLMILPFYLIFVKEAFSNYEMYLGAFVISQIIGKISSNFLWAYITSRFGPEKVMQVCILIGSLIPLIAMVIRPLGPSWYILVFLLIGFISSGRSVGFEPYLLDISPDENRTLYLGIRGSLNIFVVLLPLLGGLFIKWLGFYITFSLVSIVMLTTFFILWRK